MWGMVRSPPSGLRAAGSSECGQVGSAPAEGSSLSCGHKGKLSITVDTPVFLIGSPGLQPGMLPDSHPQPLLPSLLYLEMANFIWK